MEQFNTKEAEILYESLKTDKALNKVIEYTLNGREFNEIPPNCMTMHESVNILVRIALTATKYSDRLNSLLIINKYHFGYKVKQKYVPLEEITTSELINPIFIDTSKYYVYALYNSEDNKIFYIGKGIKKRYLQHFKNNKNDNNYHKINTIKKLGINVQVGIIAYDLTEDDAFAIEKKYIRLHRDNLTNISGGKNTAKTNLLEYLSDKKDLLHHYIKIELYKQLSIDSPYAST